MKTRDILAIGASAGGVQALMSLARNLQPELPAAVLVTIHLAPHVRSALDKLLTEAGPLAARFAADGEEVKRGTIYLAPPDRHLLMDSGRLWLGSGPRENNARPAIDPMLRSVAACCGGRAVGLVLTGTLGDGASGLWTLSEFGGCTVVQDPSDAAFSEMPNSALELTQPDHVVALDAMPALLRRLVDQPAGSAATVTPKLAMELKIARGGNLPMHEMDRLGRRSVFTCPECHGVMWEIKEGDLVRYRCHVGHAYTEEFMSLALDESLYRAMSTALRAIEERVELSQKLRREAENRNQHHAARTWAVRTEEFRRELAVIEGALQRMDEIAAVRGDACEQVKKS